MCFSGTFKLFSLPCLVYFCNLAATANLVRDSDVNIKPISRDFRLSEDPSQGTLALFTEDSTWNQCLKLELKEFGQNKDDFFRRFFSTQKLVERMSVEVYIIANSISSEKIFHILDKFTLLEARRQQYECYREDLLTFQEKKE